MEPKAVVKLPTFRHPTDEQLPLLNHFKGWRMVPRKTWVSKNFGRISKSRKRFDQSQSLVFAWFAFTFFESRNFLPKSL